MLKLPSCLGIEPWWRRESFDVVDPEFLCAHDRKGCRSNCDIWNRQWSYELKDWEERVATPGLVRNLAVSIISDRRTWVSVGWLWTVLLWTQKALIGLSKYVERRLWALLLSSANIELISFAHKMPTVLTSQVVIIEFEKPETFNEAIQVCVGWLRCAIVTACTRHYTSRVIEQGRHPLCRQAACSNTRYVWPHVSSS